MRALLLAGAAACWAGAAIAADPQAFSQVERGHYLTIVGDCQPCHTVEGGAAFAGGRAIDTPFGTLLSPNITPDQQTGIGGWTDAEFYRAMHSGIGRGGNHLYPAFPYTAFTHVTRDDVMAIRAYLDTLPAVHNPVHSNQLPFPLDIRTSAAAWDTLFFDKGTFQPDPAKSAEWNRGAYIVQGLGHCGTCHTPKSTFGADEDGHFAQGYEVQGWFAPDLTGDKRTGLGRWSVDDVVEFLQTGRNAFQPASGPMAEVISYSTSQMTPADLRAIAIYLKSLPAPDETAPTPLHGTPDMQHGAAIFVDACAACHTARGTGVPHLFPSLAGSASVQSDNPASLIRVVLQGTRAVATDRAPTGPGMPGFGWKLSDAEVAAVVTYIRNAWGNAAAAVSERDVRSARQTLAERAE